MSFPQGSRQWTGIFLGLTLGVLLSAGSAAAQQMPPEVARMGWADTIFVNGKLVSMDDTSRSTEVGSTYQAIAIKRDRIMKLGTNAEVRTLAGPDTVIHDLRGRLMIPGIIEPHSHNYGGAPEFLDRLGYKYPPGNAIFVRAVGDPDLEKTQGIIRDTIQDAVEQVNPGDWIVMSLRSHPDARGSTQFWGMTRRLTNRRTLDEWAPENPVLMRPGLRGNINSKALETLNEFLPGYSESIQESMHGDVIHEDIPALGWVGSQEMSVITWELFLKNVPLNILAQAIKLNTEDWVARGGVTTFSSRIQFPKIMSGYATLAGLGQMPVRLSAHYEVHRMPVDPQQTRQIYRRTGVLQGIGDDYFWIDGVASERWDSFYPESCTAQDLPAAPHLKARETCPKPGDLHWDTLSNAMKSGWRLAGVHICGSESARAFFRLVDEARAVNGWSLQDVRDRRLTGEHCGMIGKQPDVIQKLKDYGIIISCGPDIIDETPFWVADYGEAANDFVLPFKTWIDSGVKVVGQHFGGSFPYEVMWNAIAREFDDGQVYQPEERIDRVHAMKMWTSWASEYVFKEDDLGTLEVGKFADLVVLDKDFFTIPVDEIKDTQPLMTFLGGKFISLQGPLAQDFGVQAIGPQVYQVGGRAGD